MANILESDDFDQNFAKTLGGYLGHLTLFQYTGYQFGTALPFSLYLRHGFRSDSENVYGNRVKASLK